MGSWMKVWILCNTVTLTISVSFKTGRPVYVELGQTLVLEATFEKNPDEKIDMVTWERQRRAENIRLLGTQGSRISLEKNDALLRITDVAEADIGIYKVTVTDSNGNQLHDSIEVRKIVEPPKASITRVLECVVDKRDMMQWNNPQFLWLIDGVAVTNQSALLADGRLDISEVKGVNYTCIIKSSLGTLTTHYEIPKESQPCCSGMIATGVVVALAVVLVTGLYFLRRTKRI